MPVIRTYSPISRHLSRKIFDFAFHQVLLLCILDVYIMEFCFDHPTVSTVSLLSMFFLNLLIG